MRVNGEERPAAATVAALLAELEAPPEGVAVAVNGEVVPRREWATRALSDEDRVEVIRAVGGG
ncbi:MAG: sulfur carrier protein ThiS [Myxococcota bacterium]